MKIDVSIFGSRCYGGSEILALFMNVVLKKNVKVKTVAYGTCGFLVFIISITVILTIHLSVCCLCVLYWGFLLWLRICYLTTKELILHTRSFWIKHELQC